MDPALSPLRGPAPVPGLTLKVIGAGFSRTGTKTFSEAMTILYNLPVHDAGAQSMIGASYIQRNWLEIMRLAPVAITTAQKAKLKYLLAETLDGYVATSDTPVCHFTKEIADLYPDAVVVVTTRDKESWHRSVLFMSGLMSRWYVHLAVWPVPKLGVFGRWNRLLDSLHRWRFGPDALQPDNLEVHEQQIRDCIPKDRLFFYNVKDGWEPLCKRLGLPVPKVPFPHNNDHNSSIKDRNMMITVGLTAWLIYLGGLSASAVFMWQRLGWTS